MTEPLRALRALKFSVYDSSDLQFLKHIRKSIYLDIEVHISILFTIELLIDKTDFFEARVHFEFKVFPFQRIVH